jgi:stress response protein SCP2
MDLIRGQKVTLQPQGSLEVVISFEGSSTYDFSCFGVDGNGKLSDDRYFVFYNQKTSPNGEIKIIDAPGKPICFSVDLSKLPSSIQRLIFTASIDGNDTMRNLRQGIFEVFSQGASVARFILIGSDFQNEKAIIVAEIYRKNQEWRLGAEGQGFNGGLSALLAHFGGEELKEMPAPAPAKLRLAKIELDKKMAQQAPTILNLAKKAEVSLEKKGLLDHQAQVALCLDISGSMYSLYKSGKIQRLAEKVLALGTRFDDNGSIDIFLFNHDAQEAGSMDIGNFSGFINNLASRVEGGTDYSKAIALMREFYFGSKQARKKPHSASLPVYVLFLTDGACGNPDRTREQLRWSSYEPIFFQFMAIGISKKEVWTKGGGFFQRLLTDDFSLLEELDNLSGRYVDNANFFSVRDPEAISDDQLYDLLMGEYPDWLKLARQHGLLPL